MKFENSKQKITQEELSLFEKQNKIKLPESYKKVILEHNGGYPEREYFQGRGIYFKSIIYGNNTIDKSIKILFDVLPKGFLPFGQDGGGWLFCFDLNHSENYGKIYLYQSDGEYYRLANSFEEFMNELSENEDY